MSNFMNVWTALHKENLEATKEKKHGNVAFSRKKKAILTQALLNTPDYKVEITKTKKGEIIKESCEPVKEFRNQFIKKILVDNGVDKQQAEKAAKEYEFSQKQADALYPLESENIEQYLRAGFTYKMMEKADFNAAIKMRDVPEATITAKSPATGAETKTHVSAHKIIVKKSGAPKCCKKKVK